MGSLARHERVDFEAIQTSLAWGTVTASFTIEAFSLEGIASRSAGDLESRLQDFRAAARVGQHQMEEVQ